MVTANPISSVFDAFLLPFIAAPSLLLSCRTVSRLYLEVSGLLL